MEFLLSIISLNYSATLATQNKYTLNDCDHFFLIKF